MGDALETRSVTAYPADMAKLTNLPSLLRKEPPRLKVQDRDQRRYVEQPWRKWYQSTEWRMLRLQAFERDGYVCQRSGVMCVPGGTGQEDNAPVANHRIRHKGDRALFFNLDNIETVTKKVHDEIIQREEKQADMIERQFGFGMA
jgi:5-methylcytosine-specific restriction protein A